MAWAIEFDLAAGRELGKIDPRDARRILAFMYERVALPKDSRGFGEALEGSRPGQFWKHRIGDYRVIASIEDARICILVLRIGNRRDIYRKR
jgi:mRNA interferase RelE/StbE